jgi:alpha-L-arabinofuranosidase
MDAQLMQCMVECERLENGIENLSVSASSKDDTVTVTIANFTRETTVRIDGVGAKKVSGQVLSGSPRAYNTFEKPDAVCPELFSRVKLFENYAEAILPANSIVALSFGV